MGAKVNKKVFTIHQWLGLYAGVMILFLTITGAMLVFGGETDAALNGSIMTVTPGAKKASLDIIAADLKKRYPGYRINKMELQNQYPTLALYADVEKGHEGKTQVFYNQYTGAYMGARAKDAGIVHAVKKLHTEFLLSRAGKIMVALMGLALFITTISGIYFYRKSLLSVFRIGIRWNKNAKTISSDMHKLVGVSTLVFNLVIAATGFYMHRNELLPGHHEDEGKYKTANGKQFTTNDINFSLDAIVDANSSKVAGFMPGVIDFPKPAHPVIKLKGNTPQSSRLTGGKFDTEIVLAAAGQSVEKIITPANTPTYKKADKLMHELHYGWYGGMAIQLLYTVCGLCTGLLSVTGFILWYKKRKKAVKPAARKAPSRQAAPVPA
ncbi:PepSY-associated TM helix domain-containing protein [Foetidibacter luteolus]|uniref:PepSY-associated TM helix domain-containing protein n=1 Tax=Foetidibacter luteolus TaxID=2608880 RepID=UPI00129BBBF1|nr:PepSY-associated TM helix domain-containing protein [Foetidibacter luteolus]